MAIALNVALLPATVVIDAGCMMLLMPLLKSDETHVPPCPIFAPGLYSRVTPNTLSFKPLPPVVFACPVTGVPVTISVLMVILPGLAVKPPPIPAPVAPPTAVTAPPLMVITPPVCLLPPPIPAAKAAPFA